MSLEQMLEDHTVMLSHLIVALNENTAALLAKQAPVKTSVSNGALPIKEATPVATPVTATATAAELSSLCANLIQHNRLKNKPLIVTILAHYGGAKIVSDVPKDKLPELEIKLNALKASE